jgi:hypothetical protein
MGWQWRQTGRQWLIGKWADRGSADMDVQGESLPAGLVARCEIAYSDGRAREYRVHVWSPSQGWQTFAALFATVAIEGNPGDVLNGNGEIGPQGRPAILFHRLSEAEPLMVKIVHFNTNGRVTRTYTFVEAYREP